MISARSAASSSLWVARSEPGWGRLVLRYHVLFSGNSVLVAHRDRLTVGEAPWVRRAIPRCGTTERTCVNLMLQGHHAIELLTYTVYRVGSEELRAGRR